jgi:alpha-amylase/alpha-mannosidase (GH57 family)
LKSTEKFTDAERAKLVSEPWNAFGISNIQIAHFPEYEMMRRMDPERLTTADLRDIKTWFFVAHFDPDFLRGTSALDVNLTDLIEERDGQFFVRDGKRFTERDANRMVAEAVRVMQEVIPEHAKLLASGQLEIITTPFYHPILPLLIDTDIAKMCMPKSELPSRFAYPQDAHAQVIKGVSYYESLFRRAPQGMWPAEGSISQAAAEVFRNHNVKWMCGDMRVLEKSKPEGLDIAQPYRVSTPDGDIAVVFRETTLSDHIGFTYQNMDPDSSVDHFISEILKFAPTDTSDRLLTVILDGENAWEWYRYDLDAKKFLNGLYTKLTELREQGRVTCVNPTEYFRGNNERNIPAHPIAELTEISDLWPGSWINANYDTWIGEKEENDAWDYLLKTRQDLEKSGLAQPDPRAPMEKSAHGAAIYRAYESMYAAEGSDWFWWYGADQGAPGGDRPFETAFFSHLRAVYKHMRDAGVESCNA